MKNQNEVRPGHAAGAEGRSGGRRRLLRPAMAVLGHAGDSGIPARPSLYNTNLHVMDGGGTFRARFGVERVVKTRLPTARGREGQPSRRRLLLARLGDQGRLSGVHLRRCSRSSAGTRTSTESELAVIQTDRRRQSRRRVLVDRPLGRHPARCDEARLHPLRQRQGARQCVEPAGSDPGASRADLHAAAGARREISDACRTPSSSACPTSASTCRRRRSRRASPSSSRSSSPRAVWSNTKAAARRPAPTSGSPSCSRTCSSRSIRRMPPSAASRTAPGSGSPAPRTARRRKVKALVTERVGKGVAWMPVPLRRLVPGRRPAQQVSEGRRSDRAGRERQHAHHLRLRSGDRHAGTQSHALPDQGGVRRQRPWLG